MRSFYQHSIQPLDVLTINQQNVLAESNSGWFFRDNINGNTIGGVAKLLQIGINYSFSDAGPYQPAVGFVNPGSDIFYSSTVNTTIKIYNKGLFNIRGNIGGIFFSYTPNIELDGLININFTNLNGTINFTNPNVKKVIFKNTKNIQSSLINSGDTGIELNNTTSQLGLTDIRFDYPYYDFISLGTSSPAQVANISAVTFNYQYGMEPSVIKTNPQNRLDIIGTKIKNLDLSYVKFSNDGYYRYNSNTQLTGITLASQVSSVAFFHAFGCNLGYIDFKPVTGLTNLNSCQIRLENNNMTADEVNHILYDLDNLSVGGYTSRLINIGGTNASPTSVGTWDGIAARNSLISKSFTVTI
jgi:hypothetical protein